jgi:hypothetical protein
MSFKAKVSTADRVEGESVPVIRMWYESSLLSGSVVSISNYL